MTAHLRSALALLFTTALSLAVQAEPAKDATLAIAAFDARGRATADQASLVSDLLTATLVNDGKLRVVERAQMAKVMKEQTLSASGIMSDEVQIKVAQLVGARWIMIGSIQNEGAGYVLTARAIDSSSAQVAFADTLKLGSADQISAGARQLARRLQDKLTGSSSAKQSGEAVGDFDPSIIKEMGRQFARLMAVKFPKVEGHLKEVLPNNTSGCRFSDPKSVFQNQRFNIVGVDSITGQGVEKGIFLVTVINDRGCSGKYKGGGAEEIVDNDVIKSLPLTISMDPLRVGPGADPEMGKLFSDEAKDSLKNQAAFEVTDSPQVTLVGSISGGRCHRVIEVQALEKGGAVIQRWDLVGTF
jgi:hypothetical protein